MTSIKIKLPAPLPSEGLTPVKFKIWKSLVTTYLSQSQDYQRFLHGGVYSTWIAADENEHRLDNLHATDQAVNAAHNANRLQQRRTQLSTALSVVASITDPSQYDDIMMRSTSFQWIWNLIETDYDIQKKGRHFLKLDKIVFSNTGTESHTAFYKRLRAHFTDNLRKQGEQVKSMHPSMLMKNLVPHWKTQSCTWP